MKDPQESKTSDSVIRKTAACLLLTRLKDLSKYLKAKAKKAVLQNRLQTFNTAGSTKKRQDTVAFWQNTARLLSKKALKINTETEG